MRLTLPSLLLLALAPGVAVAQDAGLYHARTGALLATADENTKLLYAVATAKVFDVELSKTLLTDLKRNVGDAKSSAFRASQLLEDAPAAADVAKLDEALRALEASFQKADADVKNETKGMKIDEDNPDIAPAAGAKPDEEAKQPDWELLKDSIGAVYRDVSAARAAHGKLVKAMKAPPLKAPPAPKKK
jgi:hypothetical protein